MSNDIQRSGANMLPLYCSYSSLFHGAMDEVWYKNIHVRKLLILLRCILVWFLYFSIYYMTRFILAVGWIWTANHYQMVSTSPEAKHILVVVPHVHVPDLEAMCGVNPVLGGVFHFDVIHVCLVASVGYKGFWVWAGCLGVVQYTRRSI